MKTDKILFLLSSFIIFSCSTYKRDKFTYDYSPNTWVNMYKDEVFYASLKEGYKNDTIFKLMGKKDFFTPLDGMSFEERKNAALLGKKIIQNMPKPIIPHCDDCNQKELLKMNYISSNALRYYASKELDSIARIEYQKHLKNEKENEKNMENK